MEGSGLHKLLTILFMFLLAFQPEKANGIRNIESGSSAMAPNFPKEVEAAGTAVGKRSGVSPSSLFDLNRMSKRRVRRGSDPIHNRC